MPPDPIEILLGERDDLRIDDVRPRRHRYPLLLDRRQLPLPLGQLRDALPLRLELPRREPPPEGQPIVPIVSGAHRWGRAYTTATTSGGPPTIRSGSAASALTEAP